MSSPISTVDDPQVADPPAAKLAATTKISENGLEVLRRRYLRKGIDGEPLETVPEMFWRVASNVALPERGWNDEETYQKMAESFYDLLTTLRFFPNSPTFTGAGTPLGQLAACFVLAIADDMGKDSAEGIFSTLRNAALIQQTGGGNGFSFSRLRPKGDSVNSSAGVASGPVGFLKVYDAAFGEIAQGGCLLPETLVFTADGLLRLDELVDASKPGWQEHRVTVATDEGQRQSPRGFNNGVQPVMTVATAEGLSLTGTLNHKVKVMTGEGPAWRRLDELHAGDAILVMLGQHQGRLRALRRPGKTHGNQAEIGLPSILDEALAFLLGYLAGDGFVSADPHDHRVGFSVAHDSYLLHELPTLLQQAFPGCKVHRQQKAGDASVTFVLDSALIKRFLVDNGFAKAKSHEVRVPRLVRQSPANVVGAYLRGLFEADGGLSHGYPQLTTTSEQLAHEVATLLLGLGCPVTVRTADYPGRLGSRPQWIVRINSSVGLEAWRARIGCDQRSRIVNCYTFRPDAEREASYVLPHAEYWLQPVLDEITLPQIDRQGRGQGINWRASDPPLRRKLLRYLRGERRLTISAYRELSAASPEFAQHARPVANLWFVHVAETRQAGEALTLDLEVEGNRTYLAGGLVTHNTRRGANMGVLRVDHPDIEEFIAAKATEGQIVNFNISVGVTDAFMEAVKADADFDLINPRSRGVTKTVKARKLFDTIVTYAHRNGEPGVLFLDAANRSNPVPHLYELEATNPCFAGDTRLATSDGFLTMEELSQRDRSLEIATDNRAMEDAKTRGCQLRQASAVVRTRVDAPVIQLTTRQGYSVVATPDHRFLTPDWGYVELSELRVGDKIMLQSGEGPWNKEIHLPNTANIEEKMALMAQGGDHASGATVTRRDFSELYAGVPTFWSQELGVALGWLVGDGWLSPSSNSPVGFAFASNGVCPGADLIRPILQNWFGPGHLHDRGSVKQLTYGRLPFEFFSSLGVMAVPAHLKRVPSSMWQAPREAVVGFLQGLFGADGSVQRNDAKQDCTVRLASSSEGLLQDVQLLLSNFGIVSRIYTRRDTMIRPMPNGKGGLKEYRSRPQYELVIGKANRNRFAELIGFADQKKQNRLDEFMAGMQRKAYREQFVDEIVAVEDAGRADVYDLNEPETNSLIANGFVAHNCGEQFLGPFENCCLGSVNLAQRVTADGRVDWAGLEETVAVSTRFLDDVVSANKYVPAVPQLQDAAERVRRIGLGIMGLADMMYMLGVRYGSEESLDLAGQIMEFVRYHSMRTSIELARDRGPFLAVAGSIYDPDDLKWQPPAPLQPYTHDFGRPELDWEEIIRGIKTYGIRNGAQTTVAPTGTIGTVTGCEGYGCEPVFALAYTRYVKEANGDVVLTYVSPQFLAALDKAEIIDERREQIVDQILQTGTCQGVDLLPDHIRHTFVVSQDITPTEHVLMQAVLQCFVDNSISKTINFPENATVDDVARVYLLAWELGCKGLTVYVTGSRQEVVLETKATAEAKKGDAAEYTANGRASTEETLSATLHGPDVFAGNGTYNPSSRVDAYDAKRPRPKRLRGTTYRRLSPLGTAYITVNDTDDGEPFEVFMNVGKAGSDVAAVSEALGRLISFVLRMPSSLSPTERLQQVVYQLNGIGGGRHLGFGPQRVRSLPDAIAQVLAEHLEEAPATPVAPTVPAGEQLALPTLAHARSAGVPKQIGDLCPDCGNSTLLNVEGCRKCHVCGYSEC